ncbi:MAG: UDP-N-acetylglucosamine--N-acetylmuramyl-(pentapeptide) pyrophosphoryl-undecaprenol N-acetylglucosamine transferase [Alphaproteobacteria bacterium]
MSIPPLILVSAGGTGGHMSPASALTTALLEKGARVELVTDIRGTKHVKMFPDIPVHVVKSGTAHSGILGKIKGAVNLSAGMAQGFALVHKLKPDAVIGLGGYPSVPAVFAAQILGIPTGLHEQNAVIGKANIFLAPKAKFIALSLPLPEDREYSHHITSKTKVTGNPVRPEIIALRNAPYPPLEEKGALNIFVMGGSLGATVFSTVIPQALALLNEEQKNRLHITQQCRKADLDEAAELYKKSGIKDVTLAPFFDDVDKKLAQTHLFIGRSGAATLAEISIAGRPAIYVPYPYHKDQQQKHNALKVAERGGAWLVEQEEFTPEALHKQIEKMLRDPQILRDAAARAKECGLPEAASDLAQMSLRIIKQKD